MSVLDVHFCLIPSTSMLLNGHVDACTYHKNCMLLEKNDRKDDLKQFKLSGTNSKTLEKCTDSLRDITPKTELLWVVE